MAPPNARQLNQPPSVQPGNRPPPPKSESPSPRNIENFKLTNNVKLKIKTFYTKLDQTSAKASEIGGQSFNLGGEYMAQAKAFFSARNLVLDQSDAPGTLPFEGIVNIEDEGVLARIRQLAHEMVYEPGRLPVIFCPFPPPVLVPNTTLVNVTYGVTTPWPDKGLKYFTYNGVSWLPFVLINTTVRDDDDMVLCHEMGHAAGLSHNKVQVYGEQTHNVMYEEPTRDKIHCCQIAALARAYFAEPGWPLTNEFCLNCKPIDSCVPLFGSTIGNTRTP